MKKYLNMFKGPLILIGIIVFLTFISSLIYYLTGLTYKWLTVILLVFVIVTLFIFNFIGARNIESKGYKLGLKNGLIVVLVFYFFGSVFFGFSFSLSKLVYYLILIVTSVLGSMIGINTKK